MKINTKNLKNNHFIKHGTELFELLTHNRFVLFVICFCITLAVFLFISDAPQNFRPDTLIKIEEGVTVKQMANILKKENIIRSTTLFNLRVQLSEYKVIKAGEYLFEERENVFTVSRRLMEGDFGIPIIQVTITEGMTVREIAERMASRFPKFNSAKFINLASKYEGYLFPDTYNFNLFIDEVKIIEIMRDNFDKRISEIQDQIDSSTRTLNEIITMASIVEKEATRETIQEVSDVLWNRINIGMRLEVDAAFVYSINKNSFTVTMAELRDENNPYNTYVHTGLPPTPISNPGMESILASINTNPTDYVFFLTGRDGEMYFANDFDTHIKNRILYLD
jgi:UPF0755 protein